MSGISKPRKDHKKAKNKFNNLDSDASSTINQNLMSSSSNQTMASMSRLAQNQVQQQQQMGSAKQVHFGAVQPTASQQQQQQQTQQQQFQEQNFLPIDMQMQVDQMGSARKGTNHESSHSKHASKSQNTKQADPSIAKNSPQQVLANASISKLNQKDMISNQGGMSAAEEDDHLINEEGQSSTDRKPLDHMARLDYNVDTKTGGTLISFYADFVDYLECEDMVDPFQAKNQLLNNQTQQNNNDQAAGKANNQAKAPNIPGDDEDLEGGEDPSEATHNHQRYRFDNVIKSMVARLELYNGLAPIQEYGRHQTKANAARKNKKQQKDGSGEENKEFEHPAQNQPNEGATKTAKDNFNDQYYDLDDNFIDDDDIGLGLQEETDLLLADSGVYADESRLPGETTDMVQEKRQKREDEKIIQKFRVLNAQEVAQILEGTLTIQDVREKEKLNEPDSNGMMGVQSPEPNCRDQSDEPMVESEIKTHKNKQGDGSPPQNSGGVNAVGQSKKRDHDQAFAAISNMKLDDLTIDELLTQLKQRVLQGETLNQFKKEINVLVDQIAKKESKLEGRFTDQVGSKLASILQKSDFEMQMMLRRTFYLNKRKERKNDVDKATGLIKSKVEAILKHCNRKGESDAVVLKELPCDFVFEPKKCPGSSSDDLKQLCQNLATDLTDLIMLNNKYVDFKLKEENAKAKRPKLDKATALKNQQRLEFVPELEKILKQLSSCLSEACQSRFENRFLKTLFGMKVEDLMPKTGCKFNQVTLWPAFATATTGAGNVAVGGQGGSALKKQQMSASKSQAMNGNANNNYKC